MSEIKVNSIKGVGASAAAITVNNSDGTCTANITNNLSNRRLTINGDMKIAQRGTSSTSNGYKTVDRINLYQGNTGVTVTQSQQSLSSSDTPYTLGFRHFYRVALSAAATASANTEIAYYYNIEAQDLATSGWNYTSSSSNITLSFWFRCSTNQTFYCYLQSKDGTEQSYAFSFTASGNNAWTKITKTFIGDSNITINNDNGNGLTISFVPFFGTDLTNNKTLNTWSAFDAANRLPDMASTWLTAGASTFDLTGLQLEVGSVATDFEHRSFAQELTLCQRYFQKSFDQGVDPAVSVTKSIYQFVRPYSGGNVAGVGNDFIVEMRSQPTVVLYPVQGSGSVGQISWYGGSWGNASASYHTSTSTNKRLTLDMNIDGSIILIQYNYTASAEL